MLRGAAALGLAALLAVGGALVGLSAVALHGWWWGLTLAAAGSLAGLLALPPGVASRVPYAAGWLVPLAVGMLPRAEGDYAVASTVRGYGLIAVGMLLVALAVATVRTRRRAG